MRFSEVFFAIAPNVSPHSYAIQSEIEPWVVLSKESANSREALEEIKNHYIGEEDAWRHFFAEINNNYIKYNYKFS